MSGSPPKQPEPPKKYTSDDLLNKIRYAKYICLNDNNTPQCNAAWAEVSAISTAIGREFQKLNDPAYNMDPPNSKPLE